MNNFLRMYDGKSYSDLTNWNPISLSNDMIEHIELYGIDNERLKIGEKTYTLPVEKGKYIISVREWYTIENTDIPRFHISCYYQPFLTQRQVIDRFNLGCNISDNLLECQRLTVEGIDELNKEFENCMVLINKHKENVHK